jgi:hypothetical protein
MTGYLTCVSGWCYLLNDEGWRRSRCGGENQLLFDTFEVEGIQVMSIV